MKAKRIYRHGTPRRFACPYCMHEFSIDEILFRAPPSPELVPGKRPLLRRLLRRPPVPPNRNGTIWEAACPGEECKHHKLPISTGSEQSLVIGLVGASVSGKTHYVGSLIRQLSKDVGKRFGAGLLPLDTATSERFALEFEQGLFTDKVPPKGTKKGLKIAPLMYNLTLHGDLWREAEPRSVTLALYDTAGENFVDPDAVRELAGYLRIAAGVVFIVDPLQAVGIREILAQSNRTLPDFQPLNTPQSMISQVINLLDGHAIVPGRKRFRTPVAFTMTKCDILRDEGLIDPRDRWCGPDVHQGHFNLSLQESLESTVRGLFDRYEPGAYQVIRNRFANHAFFGVSATGSSPDPKTGRYPTVTPFRVEEPLLWLLAQIGVIPEGRGRAD